MIQDSSVLGTCDLSNNPLLGNPNIDELMCTKNGLYSAGLLPVTRSTVTTLTKTTTQLMTTRSTKSLVSTTTTQLGFSEMTTTLEPFNGATIVKVTTNTALGRTTAQQMSSNEMASGRMWLSITMSVTGTHTDTSTSSVGTESFVQEMSKFAVTLGMMLRCIISAMLLTAVFMKTPFKREFKRMKSKGKTTTTTSGLEF